MIRWDPGGSFVMEESGLSIKQAKSLAAVGEPPGCCWCIGLDEEKLDTSRNRAGLLETLGDY